MDRDNQALPSSTPFDRQLRLIMDTVPAMVWTARPDGFRDFMNRRWLEYTGLSSEQAVDMGFVAVHPEDRPQFMAH
jgi:PAS domain S-box-containing protein